MNKNIYAWIAFIFVYLAVDGQCQNLPATTAYTIASQGANHRIWERQTYELAPGGSIITNIHRYTELATGMNHLVNGQWVPSSENITISPDGSSAAATNGQHQAYFPGDIYNGFINLVAPGGKILKSQPIGLSYSDGSNSVLLAIVTNATGAILSSGNQVIYTNAFAGLHADLLYTYTKAGFEQDVVLRQQPPDPTALGLNSSKTRLQVLTEFFNPPQPAVRANTVKTAVGNLEDDTLNFGTLAMGRGKAFLLGTNSLSVNVEKRWVVLNGRQFLIEEVPIISVAQAIDTLPPFIGQANTKTKPIISKNLIVPPPRLVQSSPKARFLAQGTSLKQGLVLDYQTINSTQTNYTFRGDTSYYISGNVYLWGTNTFEGGAIIKYTNNASLTLEVGPIPLTINWLAGPYRPVVFTAKDDNTVGETISGSTGNPFGSYYANPALKIIDPSVTPFIKGFRISYAQQAVDLISASPSFYDGQLVNCQNGFSDVQCFGILVRNVLFSGVQTNFNYLFGGSYDVENCTFNASAYLTAIDNTPDQTVTLSFTNCIISDVTNLQSVFSYTNEGSYQITGDFDGFYNSPEFGSDTISNNFYPFQTVGAGSYYLADECSFFNAGTTNVDLLLLSNLQTRTTYPPIVYSNYTFTTAQTFSPQAQRDTDTPDLGYHYDTLDYAFGGCISYVNLTFTSGTAAGWFQLPGSGGPGYGIALTNEAVVSFNGTVMAPCVWAFYHTVQENCNGLWTDRGWLGGITCVYPGNSYSMSMAPQIFGDFAHFYALEGDPNHFRDYWTPLVAHLWNSELHCAGAGAYNNAYYFTNCLFDNVYSGQIQGYNTNDAYSLQNCTFHNGYLSLTPNYNPIPIYVHDCSFEGTTFDIDYNGTNSTYANYDYNAFTNGAPQFPIGGTHDVTVTNAFNWEPGPFGNYYLPTNSPLIHRGDVPASQVGLYHFTIETNMVLNGSVYQEVPEGTNTVSIGYHYVAVDQYGNPLDSNGDGIPDYIEDANGNGLDDSGEIGWNIPTDLGLNIIISQPKNGSILP